jgi:hypothetical protein
MMLAARRTSQPRTVCLSPEQQAAQKEADWLKSQDRAALVVTRFIRWRGQQARRRGAAARLIVLHHDPEREASRLRIKQARGKLAQSMKMSGTLAGIAKRASETKKQRARLEVQSAVNYVVFLALFTFSTLASTNTADKFALSSEIQTLFNANDKLLGTPVLELISSPDDVYDYLERTMPTAVYSNSFDDSEQGDVLGTNRVLGGLRLGQLRTDDVACDFPDIMKTAHAGAVSSRCNVRWDAALESKAPFGSGPTKYTYTPAVNEPGEWMDGGGQGLNYYPAPGFSMVLPNPARKPTAVAEALNQTVSQLRSNGFIDLNTRVVILDVSTYNRNMDLMAMVRVVFNFPMMGGVSVLTDTMVLRPEEYRSADFSRVCVECLLVFFVLREVGMAVREAAYAESHATYLKANFPHLLNLVLFILVWGVRARAELIRPTDHVAFVGDAGGPDAYVDYRSYGRLQTLAFDINSFNAFLSYLKVFHYMSFSPKFTQLTRTLANASSALGGFLVVFTIVMFSSSFAFMLCFGARLGDFRTMGSSMTTLLSAMLGDFDFGALREAHWLLGPVFFVSFMTISVFVMLNMFIAIISDAYCDTKTEIENEDQMDAGQLKEHVREYLFDRILYRIPIAGPIIKAFHNRVVKKAAALASNQAATLAKNASQRVKKVASVAGGKVGGGQSSFLNLKKVTLAAGGKVGGGQSALPNLKAFALDRTFSGSGARSSPVSPGTGQARLAPVAPDNTQPKKEGSAGGEVAVTLEADARPVSCAVRALTPTGVPAIKPLASRASGGATGGGGGGGGEGQVGRKAAASQGGGGRGGEVESPAGLRGGAASAFSHADSAVILKRMDQLEKQNAQVLELMQQLLQVQASGRSEPLRPQQRSVSSKYESLVSHRGNASSRTAFL